VTLTVKDGEIHVKPVKGLTEQLIGSIKLDDQKLIEEIIESDDWLRLALAGAHWRVPGAAGQSSAEIRKGESGAVGPSLGDRHRSETARGPGTAAGDRVPVLLDPAKGHFEEKI